MCITVTALLNQLACHGVALNVVIKVYKPLAALASVRCLETHRLIHHLSLTICLSLPVIAGKECHICWKEQHCGGSSGSRSRGRRS